MLFSICWTKTKTKTKTKLLVYNVICNQSARGWEAILVRTLPCQRVVTVVTKCHSAQLQNVKRMKIWVNNLTPFISAAISVTLFSNITQIYQMLPNLWHFFVFRSPRFPGSPSCRCRPCSTARGGSTPAILDKGLDQKALKPNFQHYHHKARTNVIIIVIFVTIICFWHSGHH